MIENNFSECRSSGSSGYSTNGVHLISDSSDSEKEEGCTGSPRLPRRQKRKNKGHIRCTNAERTIGEVDSDDLSYVDTLPEVSKNIVNVMQMILEKQ